MTSLTGGASAENDLKELMQQIIAERDAKFAPAAIEGGAAGPTTGMFDKPEVKSEEGDFITDLLGYLEQKRTETLESYQSKVMRKASKPLPKPEDVDVSSFLSEAGLSPMTDPLIAMSAPPELSKSSSEKLAAREALPLEELTDDEYFLRTGELREPLSPAPVEDDGPSIGLMSPDQGVIEQDVEEAMNQGETPEGTIRPKARPEGLAEKVAAITAAKARKSKLIDSVFKAEGGYSTDKDDTGNYYNGKFVGTNHGISAPVLAKELGREPTVADMKALTKTKAKQIAGEQYFDRFSIDKLPEEVQEIVLHATYMGETRGVRAMQNLLGLTPDGVMGPNTRIAMENANFTKEEYKDEYLRELQFGTVGHSKPSATWNKHGKGWTNRYTKLAK